MHIVRDCCYTRQIWCNLLPSVNHAAFFNLDLKNWFEHNLKGSFSRVSPSWNLIWGVTIWNLWKWRNCFTFQEGFQKPADPIANILQNWKYFVMSEDAISKDHEIARLSIKWNPPQV